jgi:DNA-directed RNA polymerase subunit RPC12/RpoP
MSWEKETSVIECDECGQRFEPMTDAYKCPACGTENYPDEDGEFIFTNCNVCGVRLRWQFEDRMGMCARCANE